MPHLDGFDVYHGNGNPFAWADMVARYGITLGCCKVSEGTGFVDSAWGANRAGMSKAGLRYMGFYHWLSPDQPLDAQLRNFKRIGSLGPGEFTMLDLEPTPGKIGPSKQMCLDACALWEQTYPGRFIRYQGKYFADGDSDAYAAYLWWLAYYGPSTLPVTHLPVTVWQWGGGALGVEHFDSNQIIDLVAVERLAGYGPVPVPEESDMPHFVVDENGDIWLDEIDWQGKEYTDTVGNLGIDWRLWDLPGLPVRQRALLEEKKAIQSRPTPPPQVVVPLGDHFHVPGGVAQ